ncbi:tetratricopeptide repeat protein, partial [Microseira wollei]|uniref:tetratricopeptide repeat protein n=1 Tax=Microseira wollei TaxID=467598 RepID=UPI001CFC8F07
MKKSQKSNRKKEINLVESSVQSLLKKAVEQHESGKLYPAENLYKQVVKILPNHLNAYVALAEILQAENKLAEAIEAYKKVLKLQPNNQIAVVAINNLGNAFKEKGKLDEAVEYYQQALKIKPDADVYNNLATTLS